MLLIKTLLFVVALFLTWKVLTEIAFSWKMGRDLETKWIGLITCILWGVLYYLTH